jgi:hypothetical protein
MNEPAEFIRRKSLCDLLEEYLKEHANVWIPMADLAKVAGVGGWRSRLSELRLKRGMAIEHNGKNGAASCHRYLSNPLGGRDAAAYVSGQTEMRF